MDGIDELNKVIKSCGDDVTMQVKQAFKLMASQFMGSRSFHHEKTHKTIYFEDLNDWLKEVMKNNSNQNSLRNNHQCTSREDTKELQISVGGEEEKVVHEEDQNSIPSVSEKYQETSHKYEEASIENIEDHFETHSTLETKQREYNDGWLNYKGVPTDGFSHLYVRDIEIRFENVAAIQISHEHKDEDLVAGK